MMNEKQSEQVVVEICVGTTCFVLGAAEFETIEQRIESRWPGKVDVRASRCLGLCKGGQFNGAPYVKINSVPIGKANAELILSLIQEILGAR